MKGEEIKKLRKSLNYSQEELGKMIGLSRSAICGMETGARPIPKRISELINLRFNLGDINQGFIENEISVNLKKYRELKELTQEELENLVGLSGVAIMRYEKGQREPSIKTIQEIAKILNVTPNMLVGWDFNSNIKHKNNFIKIVSYVIHNLDKHDLFDLRVKEGCEENLYLYHKGTNDLFATVYVSAVEKIIQDGEL